MKLNTPTPLILNTTYGGNTACTLHAAKYPNGRTALLLVDLDHQPLMHLTVNLPERGLAPGEVFIKTWSENEGVGKWMVDNNLGTQQGAVATGHTWAQIFRLSPDILSQLES